MMPTRTMLSSLAGAAFLLCAQSAFAEEAAPSAQSMELAATLVQKSGGGGLATMNGLSLPLSSLLKYLKVGPDHSKTVMSEAILPTLNEHSDDLTAIQVHSYASQLSVDELKAAIVFYDSPAGKALVRTKSGVVSSNMDGVTALFEKLKPEFQVAAQKTLKAHNW